MGDMGVAREVASSLGEYLKAQAVNAVLVTGFYMLGFAVAGVPWWPLVGFLAGILNLIPHLGPLLALAVPLVVAWLGSDDWLPVFYAGGVWLLIQIVDGFILSPRAAGKAGVNPLVAIVVTMGAAFVFGPLGMLLAVPLLAVALIVWRAVGRAQSMGR